MIKESNTALTYKGVTFGGVRGEWMESVEKRLNELIAARDVAAEAKTVNDEEKPRSVIGISIKKSK